MNETPEDPSDGRLRFLAARGVGAATARACRAAAGTWDAAAGLGHGRLRRIPGVGVERAARLRRALDAADVAVERRAIARHGAWVLACDDPEFPALLAAIPDPPAILVGRGDRAALSAPGVAVVGARRCTTPGLLQAGRFAGTLAAAGLAIISGGARGIDAAAHRAALRAGGLTVAVLGCGLDHDYPPGHAALREAIVAADGAVVTEHCAAMPPRPGNFPRRNRIVSGLALGVVVVEAARRSGALVTARLAAEEHGRDVFALPGRVDDVASAGCLELIRQGGAQLVVEPEDVRGTLAEAAALLVAGAHDAATREATRGGERNRG